MNRSISWDLLVAQDWGPGSYRCKCGTARKTWLTTEVWAAWKACRGRLNNPISCSRIVIELPLKRQVTKWFTSASTRNCPLSKYLCVCSYGRLWTRYLHMRSLPLTPRVTTDSKSSRVEDHWYASLHPRLLSVVHS